MLNRIKSKTKKSILFLSKYLQNLGLDLAKSTLQYIIGDREFDISLKILKTENIFHVSFYSGCVYLCEKLHIGYSKIWKRQVNELLGILYYISLITKPRVYTQNFNQKHGSIVNIALYKCYLLLIYIIFCYFFASKHCICQLRYLRILKVMLGSNYI